MLAKGSVQSQDWREGRWHGQEEGGLGEKADFSVAASYEQVEKTGL